MLTTLNYRFPNADANSWSKTEYVVTVNMDIFALHLYLHFLRTTKLDNNTCILLTKFVTGESYNQCICQDGGMYYANIYARNYIHIDNNLLNHQTKKHIILHNTTFMLLQGP